MRKIELKERKIRLAFDNIWDIVYKINYRFPLDTTFMEVVHTIIYTPKDDTKSKVKVL